MASCESGCTHTDTKGDLDHVTAQFKRVEQNVRERLLEIGTESSPAVVVDVATPIEIINFTHLSGRCGDKIIGVNVKFGNVYYHVYILDESHDSQVVKILGPKEESVVITGFR